MKKFIWLIIIFALIIFIGTSGVLEPMINFLVWLITLNFNSPNISVWGQIFAKYGTWFISYLLVGVLFKTLGLFDSNAMKIVYFIVSTIISFALCYVIMLFETYSFCIAIVVGIVLIISVIVFVIAYVKE